VSWLDQFRRRKPAQPVPAPEVNFRPIGQHIDRIAAAQTRAAAELALIAEEVRLLRQTAGSSDPTPRRP